MRKFAVACFTFLFISTFLTADLYASQNVKGIGVVIKSPSGQKIRLYKEIHALVIGASNYTSGWPKLECVPGEIAQVETALKNQGFHVNKVMDPTGKQLEKAFEDFIDTYGFDEENRLIFFFSGHGYTRKGGRKGYLVPVDAPDPRYDEKGFIRKSLGMNLVLTWARQIESKHALFLFDSCFSGTIFKAKALPKYPPHISDVTSRPVRQFISAGSAGEEVPARSVFTPSFIRALRGEGDLDEDGYVTGTEMGMYLHRKVLSYETGQTPQYGKIKDPDLDEGDFVFQLASSSGIIEDAPSKIKKEAILSVDSNVTGARVLLDGKSIGTTNLFEVTVSPGEHRIRVEKDEFETYQKTIRCRQGRSMKLTAFLEAKSREKSRLYVDTLPSDAKVRILNIGPKFYQGIELDAGKYHLEVSATGYETERSWAELATGEDRNLAIRLKASKNLRNIDTGASRLEILTVDGSFVDSEKIGRLFVISGKVINGYKKSRSFILVKGCILDDKGQIVKEKTAFAGNIIMESELLSLSMEDVGKVMKNRNGIDNKNVRIKPGKAMDFMIVFDDLPANMSEFTVGAVSSSPGGSKTREKDSYGRFIAYANGTVLDTETGLMWASKDNGEDINWQDAKRYCEDYRGGGYTDWRMPTRGELIGLYDKSKKNRYGYHLTDPIEITGCCPWPSETSGSDPVDFSDGSGGRDGGYNWVPMSLSGGNRALPVRTGN